jgi:cell fate regulator YaaT (PSP1 superfamily)
MAERNQPGDSAVIDLGVPLAPASIDEMRRLARERFKERVAHGGLGGGCECHDDVREQRERGAADEPHPCVAGVRFIDSGQVYYFSTSDLEVEVDDWVVVETNRGREAARVVIAPSNIALSQISGELKPVLRVLEPHDVTRMEQLRGESARAVRVFRDKIRDHHLPMKPIRAEYNFDGSQVTLHFSAPERVDFRELARDLASDLHCRVELRQVGARDEARLLGGVGRCGRTLCCSTWLPMFPEINMGMAKSQDLSLNPSKVSGVCGRLLCCLSYENEQYKQMKAIMPKLGQRVETPGGSATVIALQILKDLVTVRLDADGTETQFTAVELGFEAPGSKKPRVVQSQAQAAPMEEAESKAEAPVEQGAVDDAAPSPSKSSRRRRRRRKPRGDGPPADKSGEVQ